MSPRHEHSKEKVVAERDHWTIPFSVLYSTGAGNPPGSSGLCPTVYPQVQWGTRMTRIRWIFISAKQKNP